MLKVIDNFTGRLTRQDVGDLNSGFAKYNTTFGNDPFTNPGNLQWFEQPTSIAGITLAPVMTGKVRTESHTNYVYAFNDTGLITLNKIQINKTDSVPPNPNYDTPSVIGAIPQEVGSVMGMLYGPSMQFYGSTEKIFVGSDERISKINFTGAGASRVTNISSVQTNVPRPSAQFLGKMYWGNGNNLIEIDSTETVTSYAKLSPGFPAGTYIRDLDVTPDGNYLQITVSKNNSPPLYQASEDSENAASSESYKFYWNGTDTGYTSFETYPGYSLTANIVFGQKNYTLGNDLNGTALYDGSNKIVTLPALSTPNYGATFTIGNLLGFVTPEYVSSVVQQQATAMLYGQYDNEMPGGLFRLFRQAPNVSNPSVASGQDVIRVPFSLPVTNLQYTGQLTAYTNNINGAAKMYFSTFEYGNPNSNFHLYKFNLSPTGSGIAIGGVYETQQEVSKRKFKPTQVRFYTSPLVANNSFKIDIIGSDGNPISGGSKTFTVGTPPIVAGQDVVLYTPTIAPTYSMGVRITNLGSVNWTGVKLEIEYEEAGVL